MPADSPDDQRRFLWGVLDFLPAELRLRVASGTAIGIVAFIMLYWSPAAFAVLTFLIAAAMSWEWGRIVRGAMPDSGLIVHIVSVFAAAILAARDMAGLGILAAVVGAVAVAALALGSGRARLSGAGVLYTALPVVALGWLRSDDPLGFLATLFVLIAVAVTDVAAFVAGRTIGGPKLWPEVSPNKTWAGLLGGIAAAAVAGLLFRFPHGHRRAVLAREPRPCDRIDGTVGRLGRIGIEAAFRLEGLRRLDPRPRRFHGSHGWHRDREHRRGLDRLLDRRLCARARSPLRVIMEWQ